MPHDSPSSLARRGLGALVMGLALTLPAVTGCKSTGIPDNAKTTVVSMHNLDCADCGEQLARDLIAQEGVYKTAFDRGKAEVRVIADPQVDVFALAQSKKPSEEEWQLVEGAGRGGYLPWKAAPTGTDVLELNANGADVPDIQAHLVAGKFTIVDFSAKWCEPCRALDEHVLALLSARPDVAYRKLDVGDWDTPLAARYLDGVTSLPYVLVYDPAKNKVDTIVGLDLPRLDKALSPGAGGTP